MTNTSNKYENKPLHKYESLSAEFTHYQANVVSLISIMSGIISGEVLVIPFRDFSLYIFMSGFTSGRCVREPEHNMRNPSLVGCIFRPI